MPEEVQGETRSFNVRLGARIRIKDDCESREEFKGKIGRLVGCVPFFHVEFTEEIDRDRLDPAKVFLVPFPDLEYIPEEETEWEV